MSWILLTVLSVMIWGLADVISKKGTDINDEYSHVRFVICNGVVMLFALPILGLFSESGQSIRSLLAEYPVFFCVTLAYLISLLFSFFSFRNMEASVSSPLCNTSAAMVFFMLLFFYIFTGHMSDVYDLLIPINVFASILICVGVIAIGIVRSDEEKEISKRDRILNKSIKYGAAAILFPLLSAFFDALESVGDSLMVDENAGVGIGSIDYMRLWALTYLFLCIPLWIYLFIKEKKVYQPLRKSEGFKLTAGLAEVIAYTIYIVALDQEPFFVSFLSSTYCVFSIIFSHIFIHEKLSRAQYICIFVIIMGLMLFGISEGLA